jgi:hypothetical protein
MAPESLGTEKLLKIVNCQQTVLSQLSVIHIFGYRDDDMIMT